MLVEHKTHNSYGSRAFVNYAPKEWNALPLTVRSNETLSGFKKVSKLFFLVNIIVANMLSLLCFSISKCVNSISIITSCLVLYWCQTVAIVRYKAVCIF